jgi:magnesium-transporting ATPase (P-type)
MSHDTNIEKFIEEVDRLAAILESRNSLIDRELSGGQNEPTDEQRDASELVKNDDFRKIICPVLKKGGDNFRGIAKVITPFLLAHTTSLSASTALIVIGSTALTISLTPVYALAISIVIADIGVSNWCRDYGKE